MANDPEFTKFQYPVGLAYVSSVEPFKVRWYVLPDTQLMPRTSHGPKTRDFKQSNKSLTFLKFFSDPTALKRRKGKGKPTEKEIMDQWYETDADRNWVLPVELPQANDLQKLRLADKFTIPMQFVKDTLIPACKAAGCLQNS